MIKLTQHVQDSSESISPAEVTQTQRFSIRLAFLFRRKKSTVSQAQTHKHTRQITPQPMAMAGLLAGRFLTAVSQHSLPQGGSGTKPPPDKHTVQLTAEAFFPEQRAQLLARLGIRSSETYASPEQIEMLIASLSHIEGEKRIDAAHTIADLYAQLSAEKQMHARINLILMIWRDVNPYARIAAIKALASTHMPDTSEALQIALRDEKPDVRAAAARALGNIRGKVPIITLITAVMRENEHWSVRAAALQTMGDSGERAFLNTISRALDDEDDTIRVAAIHALAQMEGLRAAPRLALIAQRDRQPHVRHAAILELENLSTDNEQRHI